MLRVIAVIPAYNEADSIARVVSQTLPYVDGVLVVDDGSTDSTAEQARSAGAQVLVQSQNSGKGAALQAGMDYALAGGYDGAVALDADGQHDPRSIPNLIAPVVNGEADMAVGSRKAEWSTRMPIIRRITNAFMSWLLSAVAGQPMEDTQSGYRLLHARRYAWRPAISKPNPSFSLRQLAVVFAFVGSPFRPFTGFVPAISGRSATCFASSACCSVC